MKLDYRTLEQRANDTLRQADAIRAQAVGREMTSKEARAVQERESAACQFQMNADTMKATEEAGLRRMVQNGHVIGENAPAAGSGSGIFPDKERAPLGAEAQAFYRYVRTGNDAEIKNAALTTTGANGGFAMPMQIVQEIVKKAHKVNPFYELTEIYDISGGNPTTYVPVMSLGSVTSWLAEAASRTEQAEPTFAQVAITSSDLAGYWEATQTWLDSTPNSEQFVIEELGLSALQELGTQLVIGTGSSQKPLGVFAATSTYTYVAGGAASTISNTSILNLVMGLKPAYRNGASFVMSPATLALCMAMPMPFTGSTAPLVTFDDKGNPWALGHRIYEAEDAPAVATNSYSVAFGDFKRAYAVALHRDVFVIRDPFTKPGSVKFTLLFRVGGLPTNPEAAVLLKTATS